MFLAFSANTIIVITFTNVIIHRYGHSFPLRCKAPKGMKPVSIHSVFCYPCHPLCGEQSGCRGISPA